MPNNDRGMEMMEMSVVRKLPRKRKSTITTNMAPSSNALPTLPTDDWMKSAWRNIFVFILTSGGRVFWIFSRLASIFSVTRSVLMLGCLEIERITAGVALHEA